MSKEPIQKEQTIEEMIAEMQALEQESLLLHTRADEVRGRIRERLASLDVSLGGAVKRARRSVSKERKTGMVDAVLAFAAERDEFTAADVSKAADATAQQTSSALSALVKRGLVDRFARGRYRITDAGRKPAE